jgi:hypothetical protein
VGVPNRYANLEKNEECGNYTARVKNMQAEFLGGGGC